MHLLLEWEDDVDLYICCQGYDSRVSVAQLLVISAQDYKKALRWHGRL